MKPQDWLLLYVGQEPDNPISPLKIQKGLFLFAMEAPVPDTEKYEFVPYGIGPCSFDIYRNLRDLTGQGLLSAAYSAGSNYPLYSLTEQGQEQADMLSQQVNRNHLAQLQQFKEFVAPKYFQDLLRSVYAKYPEYATKSHWRHLAPKRQ